MMHRCVDGNGGDGVDCVLRIVGCDTQEGVCEEVNVMK